MNDAVVQIASFMILWKPVTRRWRHARHHTDTHIVGRDPQIVVRTPGFLKLIANFVGVFSMVPCRAGTR